MTGEQPLTEQALAARARGGDQQALLSLLDIHEGLMRLHVGQLLPAAVRRRVAISDVMQETRIEALRSVSRFEWRGEGSFKAWLMQVAGNRARNAVRAHLATAKRSMNREVTKAERMDTAMHALRVASPSQVVMADELRDQVKRALDALPADYRQVLRLCRDQELSFPEAGDRMGRSTEATRKLFGRALTKFAAVLEALTGDAHGA